MSISDLVEYHCDHFLRPPLKAYSIGESFESFVLVKRMYVDSSEKAAENGDFGG